MKSSHKNGGKDTSLNDGLDKLSAAYRQLQEDEPPDLLDQAILNRARRAIGKKQRRMNFGWLHGLTTTAVFVLAFSLILNQRGPEPTAESGMRATEPANSPLEELSEKRSNVGQSNDLRVHSKADMDYRQENRPDVQAPAKFGSPDSEASRLDHLNELSSEPGTSAYAADGVQKTLQLLDKDTPKKEKSVDEIVTGELEVIVETSEDDAFSDQPRAVTEVQPSARELKALIVEDANAQAEAGQELLTIIELKNNGDDRWEAELESFIRRYPDYPLPDELGK